MASAMVNTILVGNKTIRVTEKLIKIASVEGEWYDEIEDPEFIIMKLGESKCKIDIFTFIQRLPIKKQKYNYYMEWDNVAVLRIKNFDYWLKNQITKQSRTKLKKSERAGVEVKLIDFNSKTIEEIREIYNESPIRRGKPFIHYKEDFETINRDLSDRLEKANFIGAYLQDELIGFIKLLYAGETARTCVFISKIKHRDKGTNNALLAKAVEICATRGILYLVYGQFTYGKKGTDSLSDFKRHLGFKKVDIPRYYIPLSVKGKITLQLRLHNGILLIFPSKLITILLYIRKKWYDLYARVCGILCRISKQDP